MGEPVAQKVKRTLNELLNGVSEKTALHWKLGLSAGALAFLPAVFLYAFALRKLFLGFGTLINLDKTDHFETEQVQQLMGALLPPYAFLILASLLFYFAESFVNLFNLKAVFSRTKPVWSDFLPRMLQSLRLMPSVLGQGLLLVALEWFVALSLAGLGMVFVFWYWMAQGSGGPFNAVLVIVMMVSLGGAFVFNLWLSVKAEFILPVLAEEKKSGVFESLGKSFAMVKGRFWRVFGLSALVRISLSFALSVSIGPIVFFLMLPGYLELIKASSDHTKEIVQLLPKISLSFVVGLSASYYLQALGRSLIYPIFLGLFYLGLKTRKK
ncbi:MAG: hypothetical protein JNM63_12725 [Spirochaetia bacterium]|nr:hypothetical protein [Spirochaetia bacterium]